MVAEKSTLKCSNPPSGSSTKSCSLGNFFQSYCIELWFLQAGKNSADGAMLGHH